MSSSTLLVGEKRRNVPARVKAKSWYEATEVNDWLDIGAPFPVASFMNDESLYSLMARSYSLSGMSRAYHYLAYIPHRLSITINVESWWLNWLIHANGSQSITPTAREAVIRHSSLPFHLYFAEPGVRELCLAGHATHWSAATDFYRQKVRNSGRLMKLLACPLCVAEEQDKFGFSWWHQSHQLDGVSVCAKHQVPLVGGCSRCGLWGKYIWGFDLPSFACKGHKFAPTTVIPEGDVNEQVIAYARDACTMQKEDLGMDLFAVAKTIRETSLGGFRGRSTLATKHIAKALIRSFGSECADTRAECRQEQVERWVRLALQPMPVGYSTKRYLMLVVQLMGGLHQLQEAMTNTHERYAETKKSVAKRKPERPISKEYLVKCILRVRGKSTLAAPLAGLTAWQFERWVSIYGLGSMIVRRKLTSEVRARVRIRLMNGEPVNAIATEVGLGVAAVARIMSVEGLGATHQEQVRNDKRKSRRASLLNVIGNFKCRSELKRNMEGTYSWLREHDVKWLRHQLNVAFPCAVKRIGSLPVKDWADFDKKCAESIVAARDAAIEMQVDVVRRVGRGEIGRQLGFDGYDCKPDKMPRTRAALARHAESAPAFKLRRLVMLIKGIDPYSKKDRSRICNQLAIQGRRFWQLMWLAGYSEERSPELDFSNPDP